MEHKTGCPDALGLSMRGSIHVASIERHSHATDRQYQDNRLTARNFRLNAMLMKATPDTSLILERIHRQVLVARYLNCMAIAWPSWSTSVWILELFLRCLCFA